MTTSERPVVGTELGGHGAVSYVPPSARWGRRRRRPTGAPPPLPRTIGTTGKLWLACSVLLIAWMVVTVHSAWARRVTDRVDAAVSRAFARARTGWLSDILRAVDRAATGWTMSVVAIGLVVSMIVFRRWRHLFTYLASAWVFQTPRSLADRDLRQTPAVRRHSDRALGRLLAALGDGCDRELHGRRR